MGKSFYTKGTCKSENPALLYTDYCEGDEIKEHYCGTYYTQGLPDPPICEIWDWSVTCPEGCQDGKCITTLKDCGNGYCDIDETDTNCPGDCPLPTTGCTDTDGGANLFQEGMTTGENVAGVVHTDYCSIEYWLTKPWTVGVEEAVCSGDDIIRQPYDCPSGYVCRDGYCQTGLTCTPGQKCIDNDFGDPHNISNKYEGYQDSSCIWSNIKLCPQFCSDGECAVACYDPDGISLNIKSTCLDATGNYTDYCDSSTVSVEYWCNGVRGDQSSWRCRAGKYASYCPKGCSNGACIP